MLMAQPSTYMTSFKLVICSRMCHRHMTSLYFSILKFNYSETESCHMYIHSFQKCKHVVCWRLSHHHMTCFNWQSYMLERKKLCTDLLKTIVQLNSTCKFKVTLVKQKVLLWKMTIFMSQCVHHLHMKHACSQGVNCIQESSITILENLSHNYKSTLTHGDNWHPEETAVVVFRGESPSRISTLISNLFPQCSFNTPGHWTTPSGRKEN